MIQKDGKAKFPSEEARKLDMLYKEVGIQSNHLGMTLVQTREKLKPFVDDGVVHKDRKKETKRATDDFINQKKNADLEERICSYKIKIQESIEEKNIPSLEKIVAELTMDLDDNPDNIYVQQTLRLNIIHAQICIREFFKWKEAVKE